MTSAQRLLEKSRSGILSEGEVAQALDNLNRRVSAERYTLLHALGLQPRTDRLEGVVSALLADHDEDVVGLSLRILCVYWRRGTAFTDQLVRILRAESTSDDLKLAVLHASKAVLRSEAVPHLLAEVLRVFESEAQLHLLREAAYLVLGEASGRPWQELPPASRSFDLKRDVDPAVIDWARAKSAGGKP